MHWHAADVTGDAEEEEVDVLTKEEIAVFSSDDDEDSQALHYLRAVRVFGPSAKTLVVLGA